MFEFKIHKFLTTFEIINSKVVVFSIALGLRYMPEILPIRLYLINQSILVATGFVFLDAFSTTSKIMKSLFQ